VLSCYTHPELAFLVVVHLIAFLIWTRSVVERLGIIVVVLLAAGAGFPAERNAIFSPEFGGSYVPPPSLKSAKEIGTFLASAGGAPAPVSPVNHALLGFTAAVWIIGLGVLLYRIASRKGDTLGFTVALLWLVVPFVLAWIVSETGRPDFLDRYLIESLPGAAVLLAMVLVRVRPRIFGFLGVAYLLAFRAGVLAPSYGHSIDDFAQASRIVLTNARPGDCITFDVSQIRFMYDYYARQTGRGAVLPLQVLPPIPNEFSPYNILRASVLNTDYVNAVQSAAGVEYAAARCERFWLFISHAGTPTGTVPQRALWDRQTQLRHDVKLFYSPVRITHVTGVGVELYERTKVPAQPLNS
jgi:hypothetical protein